MGSSRLPGAKAWNSKLLVFFLGFVVPFRYTASQSGLQKDFKMTFKYLVLMDMKVSLKVSGQYFLFSEIKEVGGGDF